MRYGCSGWKYRGLSVCSNTTIASRKLVEGLLLEAIQRDLFTKEGQAACIQETTKLLTAQQRGRKPEHQQATKRLQCVEQEIAQFVKAIAQGIFSASTKAELDRLERNAPSSSRRSKASTRRPRRWRRFCRMPSGASGATDDLSNVTQLQVDQAAVCCGCCSATRSSCTPAQTARGAI
jgi:hypothetical protein